MCSHCPVVERSESAAASMLLWTGLVESALDSDYPAAAKPDRTASAGRMATGLVAVLISIILVGAAVSVINQRPSLTSQREQLAERITAGEAGLLQLEAEVATLEASVEALSAALLDRDATGQALAARVTQLEGEAGITEREGPGLTVTLADSESGATLGRVTDRDLQSIVNGLWEAGATAVAINGVRLTSRTAIRSAGSAILVGYRPLAPPYQVTALDTGRDRFDATQAARTAALLEKEYGIGYDLTEGSRIVPAAVTP